MTQGYYANGQHYCQYGHATVYQMFSAGKEWFCAICHANDAYAEGEYPAAPINAGPRARLLQQPGGFEELKLQMQAELERLNNAENESS